MTIRFFKRKTAIHLRVNSGKRGESSRLSTGVNIGTGMKWDDDGERFVSTDKLSIQSNARISEIKGYALRAANSYKTYADAAHDIRKWLDETRPRSMTNKPANMSKLLNKEMGYRLKRIRQDKGLTQKEFAEELGMSAVWVSSIEVGRHQLSVDTLVILKNKYGIPYEFIIDGQYNPHRKDQTQEIKELKSERDVLLKIIQQMSDPTRRSDS